MKLSCVYRVAKGGMPRWCVHAAVAREMGPEGGRRLACPIFLCRRLPLARCTVFLPPLHK